MNGLGDIKVLVEGMLENFLLDEHREEYKRMTLQQQTIVKLAIRYGQCVEKGKHETSHHSK